MEINEDDIKRSGAEYEIGSTFIQETTGNEFGQLAAEKRRADEAKG